MFKYSKPMALFIILAVVAFHFQNCSRIESIKNNSEVDSSSFDDLNFQSLDPSGDNDDEFVDELDDENDNIDGDEDEPSQEDIDSASLQFLTNKNWKLVGVSHRNFRKLLFWRMLSHQKFSLKFTENGNTPVPHNGDENLNPQGPEQQRILQVSGGGFCNTFSGSAHVVLKHERVGTLEVQDLTNYSCSIGFANPDQKALFERANQVFARLIKRAKRYHINRNLNRLRIITGNQNVQLIFKTNNSSSSTQSLHSKILNGDWSVQRVHMITAKGDTVSRNVVDASGMNVDFKKSLGNSYHVNLSSICSEYRYRFSAKSIKSSSRSAFMNAIKRYSITMLDDLERIPHSSNDDVNKCLAAAPYETEVSDLLSDMSSLRLNVTGNSLVIRRSQVVLQGDSSKAMSIVLRLNN